MIFLLAATVVLLAWWNGANDDFKGVATLYGSNTLTYRMAVLIATLATLAGSLCAVFVAQGLVCNFSGKGLVPDAIAADVQFLIATRLGAAVCTA